MPVFPVRPSGMWALPLRVRLEHVAGRGARAEVRLFAPPATGRRWTAYPNSPWLQCIPPSGEARAAPQAIAVTFSPGKEPDIRLHRGAVTFRTDAGFNRTVMVDVKVYHPRPVAISFEAEEGKVSGGFQRAADPAASGGAYLHRPEDAEPGSVEFSFDIPEQGVYYVAALCMAPGPKTPIHDSFFSSMDGEEKLIWDLSSRGSDWNWDLASARKVEYPRRFRLSRGRHVLTISSREALARLDRVVVTNSPYAEEPRADLREEASR